MAELLNTELTVTELTSLIKKTLEEGFYGLRVSGEISNFRPTSAGHWFFTLKDSNSAISAVMFKGSTWKVDFTPAEGDKVVVTGSLDVYGARGTYQIKCDTMEKAGLGELLLLLQMRRRLYESKGYFANELKSPIPRYPKRVGVVTSAGGAALQDILNITARRAPMLDILVLPAVVQGTTAAQTIANRIRQANELLLCDVLIVGRGGGSLEDLLPFSEECVIEAIHDSSIPVISAVGHEIDWALSDYVADLRAPTPSAAAELVSQGYLDLQMQAKALKQQVARSMQTKLLIAQQRLRGFDQVSRGRRMEAIIGSKEYLLANASQNLATSMKHLLTMTTSRLHTAHRELQALSPLAILARGYCVVQDSEQQLVRSAKQAPKGTKLSLTFIDGSRKAVVEE